MVFGCTEVYITTSQFGLCSIDHYYRYYYGYTLEDIDMTYYHTVYKLGDVGISSNLIGSLSLTNGHCPPPGRWIMKQWPA